MFNGWSSLAHTVWVGSLAYVIIIFLLRISGKRTLSKWNSFDFVVTIAFGSILASLLLSKETSLFQGVLGFGLLILYQFVLTWSAARSPWIQNLIKAKPTLLLYKGQFCQKALKNQRVTEGEVLAAIRGQGVDDEHQIGAVVLETDGSFSIIKTLTPTSSALRDVEGF